jgi:hypothetical protein
MFAKMLVVMAIIAIINGQLRAAVPKERGAARRGEDSNKLR